MRTKEYQRISIDQKPGKDGKYTAIVRGKEYKSMCKELESDLEKEEYDNRVDVFAGTVGVIGSMISGREGEATGVYKMALKNGSVEERYRLIREEIYSLTDERELLKRKWFYKLGVKLRLL